MGSNHHKWVQVAQPVLKQTRLSFVIAAILTSAQLYAKNLEVNLPKQPLSQSVQQLVKQSGTEILYAGNILDYKFAPKLKGNMSIERALEVILQDTNLTIQKKGNIYTIVEKKSFPISAIESREKVEQSLNSASSINKLAEQPLVHLPTIKAYSENENNLYREPRSVSEITRTQLDNRPAKHAADMLEQTAGVYSSVSQQDPALSVNIRGIQDFGRVNMNIDGMRQNFQKSGHGQRNGQMYIDPELLSGVRVEKGATSGMGGAGAFAGIATFSTVNANDFLTNDKNFGGKLRASTGDNSTNFIGSAIVAGRYQYFDILAGMSERRLGDYYPGTEGNIGNIRVNNQTGRYEQFIDHLKQNKITDTNYEMRSYLGKIGWNIDESQRLQLSYLKNETATPNASALKDIHDPNNYSSYYLGWTRTGFSNIDAQNLALDYHFKPENQSLWDLNSKLYYVDTKDYTDTFATNTLGTNGYWAKTRLQTYGLQLENTSKWSLSDVSQLGLNYGLDIFYDKGTSDSNREIMKGTTPSGNRLMSSLFTNLAWDYNDWLKLQGGVRYDRYRLRGATGFEITSFPYTESNPCTERTITRCSPTIRTYKEWVLNDEVDNLSPTLALAIKPGVEWLELFANYGESWRPPAITETLTYGSAHSSSTQYPNPFLKPEYSKGWEAGFNIQLADLITDRDRFAAKVAYFDTRVDDYINMHIALMKPGIMSPSIGNAAYINNMSKSRFRGIEFQLNYDADVFYADFNYTRMIGKNDYCINPAWLGGVVYATGGGRGNYYEVLAEDWNGAVACNNGSIFNSSAFLPGDRGSLTLGGRAFDKKLDTGVIVRYNPGYQDHSSPTNLPYLADWPAYTLVDLYANFKFNDQFILRGSVENVADRAYVVSYADMQSNSLGRGRTFTFGVEYTF